MWQTGIAGSCRIVFAVLLINTLFSQSQSVTIKCYACMGTWKGDHWDNSCYDDPRTGDSGEVTIEDCDLSTHTCYQTPVYDMDNGYALAFYIRGCDNQATITEGCKDTSHFNQCTSACSTDFCNYNPPTTEGPSVEITTAGNLPEITTTTTLTTTTPTTITSTTTTSLTTTTTPSLTTTIAESPTTTTTTQEPTTTVTTSESPTTTKTTTKTATKTTSETTSETTKAPTTTTTPPGPEPTIPDNAAQYMVVSPLLLLVLFVSRILWA